MKEAIAALCIFAGCPAMAWEFTPGAVCKLDHQTSDVTVALTFDPAQPLYTISLRQDAPFAPAPAFSIEFAGPLGLAIGTDQHQLSADGRTLTVTDSGFGNVLNGLQFGDAMIATFGGQSVTVSLRGAHDPVAAFRACKDVIPTS